MGRRAGRRKQDRGGRNIGRVWKNEKHDTVSWEKSRSEARGGVYRQRRGSEKWCVNEHGQ